MRPWPLRTGLLGLAALAAALSGSTASAHRDPCHLRHTCPSDHHTYAWRGLSCTSYADERVAADTIAVVVDGRRYWCHRAASAPAASTTGAAATSLRASWTLTPGVANPSVTQATIHRTVCVPGWTSEIRPPAEYTSRLKLVQMREYGVGGPPSAYEEDHLLSLELGGHPTDPRNLWPEPLGRARAVDEIESRLHDELCAGEISLAQARSEISRIKHTEG